jgi:hypothetical protein
MNRTTTLIGVSLLLCAGLAQATEITTTDGRRLTGEVRISDEEVVVLDTMLNGVRATVRLQRDGIKSIKEGPVPVGFFGPPAADARRSKLEDFGRDDTLYLEVPLRGRMGVDVFAKALQRVLTYATRHRIEHLVLRVDLRGFSGSRETRKVFDLLDRYRDEVQLHALVEQGLGDAIAVLLNCHTLHLMPDARIGGATLPLAKDEDPNEFEVRRWSLAREVGKVAAARGRSAPVLQAMIAPEIEVSVYLDGTGQRQIVSGPPPSDLAEGRLVVHDGPDSVLVFEPAALEALGLRSLESDGAVASLGASLGFESWKAESDYATQQMTKVAQAEQKASRNKQAKFERDCEKVISRRNEVQEEIRHNVLEAGRWDPSEADYSTYVRPGYWDWGGNWGTPPTDTGQLTKDSREKWQERTRNSMRYLKRAEKAIKAMGGLERKAQALGLEPLYKEGELERMSKDLKLKYESLYANRNKKER